MYKEDGTIWAEAYAKTGSLWFSGHFPGEPVLPGIAILSMVKDTLINSESQKGRKIRISGIKRVRFKLPVRQDQLLKIYLSLSGRDEDISYNFRVELNGSVACSGIVQAQLLLEESHLP